MPWQGANDGSERIYQNDDKQEAYEFLSRDIDARPLAEGMDSLKRIDAWLQVVERFDPDEDKQKAEVKEILQDRREHLVDLRRDNGFVTATELQAQDIGGQRAVADGGAVEQSETEVPVDDDLYDGAADRKSKTQKAYQKAKVYDTVEEVEDALQQEFAREQGRDHVVDALEKRLKEVAEQ